MSKDVQCPYCLEWQEINHDDGAGYDEDQKHEQMCDDCEKIFIFETTIHTSYEAEKADCLNGGTHGFEPTHTYPKEHTRMRCTTCWQERKPTAEEMAVILQT
jgi:hypothetical protein